MAIVMALREFNNLGRSVNPTFLFTNSFYLHSSPHCLKLNKKSINFSMVKFPEKRIHVTKFSRERPSIVAGHDENILAKMHQTLTRFQLWTKNRTYFLKLCAGAVSDRYICKIPRSMYTPFSATRNSAICSENRKVS